jgi:hypothetical protein
VFVLAGNESPAVVEWIAVGTAARPAKYRDALIILNPTQLKVAGHTTERHIPSDTIPDAAFIPQAIRAGVEPLDGGVS